MSTEPEPEVRYVVAGMPTGWAAVWKTVRELDEDKVKDYKEDIDTLLVFTGLFSAVLTAFLIVSYPMLSPDPQDTVVQHLAQTSSQTHSYIVTAGTMNSTVPPLSQSSQPFTPSLTALRVNYCWFGSLISALVTASFGMLVKQWLREYLSYEYASPQERLRARRFRHPGIAGWKVYQIAGALPLLLQVALGLFFLGLCFFARSENHGVGDICSALVALWASLLVTATMAPALSPRCPYKTPFLRPVMKILRRHRIVYTILTAGLIRYIPPPEDEEDEEDKEEMDAIHKSTNDLAILEDVDEFFHDDELLGTIILDSLAQSKPLDVISFVLHAISLRLQGDALRQPLSSPPDLQRLSKRAWIAVSDIVAATVKNGLQTKATMKDDWVQDAIYLLFSVSDQRPTPGARSATLQVLQDVSLSVQVKKVLGSYPSPPATSIQLLELMLERLREFISEQDVRSAIAAIAIHYLSNETSSIVVPLKSTLDLRSVSGIIWQPNSSLLASAIEADIGAYRKGQKIGTWLEDAIYILLSRPLSHPCREALIHLFSDAALRGRFASCILSSASFDSNIFEADTFSDVIQNAPADETVAFLDTMVTNPRLATPALQLVSWQFSSNFLGTMIKKYIRQSLEMGLWLEDAIRILLSYPTSYPPMQASKDAIIDLCRFGSTTLDTRFGSIIQSLVRPNCKDYPTVIRNLGEVCKNITDGPSAEFLLRTIARCLCTKQCEHPTLFLAPLLSIHAQSNPQWTKEFSSILLERSNTILTAQHDNLPPGSEESLWALMSLPAIPNWVIPSTVSQVILNPKSSAAALRPLVSADPKWRSKVVQDFAIQCVISLVKTAARVDQVNFVSALWDACDNYSDEYKRNSKAFERIGTINPVRHLSLASKIHIQTISGNGTGSDNIVFLWWLWYYAACARAMSIFKTEKSSRLPAEEKQETARIAEECLDAFDQSEPVPVDLDQSKVDPDKTPFPDAIFKELVKFVADPDAAARKSWRVRRLRKSGIIPGGEIVAVHEPAHGAEHAESLVVDEGGDGPGRAGFSSNPKYRRSVFSAQETEGVGATSQNDGGENPGTEVLDGGKVLSDAARQHAKREGLRGDEISPASTISGALGSSARGRGISGMPSVHGPGNATSRGADRTGDLPSASSPQELSVQQRDASSTGNSS